MILATHTLNHLLAQNTWALQRLAAFSGRTFTLHMPPLPASFTIRSDGLLQSGNASESQATLSTTPDALLRYVMVEPHDPALIRIGGDPTLGEALRDILTQLNWEAEEDLSRLFGDVLAHRLAGGLRDVWQWQKRSALSLAQASSEYFTEENPLIAKRMQIDQFAQEVEALRAATERLEQKFQNLLHRQAAKRA